MRPRGGTVVLGLTGSIGMGKSIAARMFEREGAAVFDADATVHALIGRGGAAVAAVETAFPGCGADGPGGREIDRAILARRVFGDGPATALLESILHPLVRDKENRFLRGAVARRVGVAVLDVPLLFETGGDRRCDAVAVVWAPPLVQAERVLARSNMTPQRLAAHRARQMPDHEKLRRADFVIPSGLGRGATLRCVRRIVRILVGAGGRGRPPRRLRSPTRYASEAWRERSSGFARAGGARGKPCAKSLSIPKPRVSSRKPVIGWSKSAVSSSSITCRPAAPGRPI